MSTATRIRIRILVRIMVLLVLAAYVWFGPLAPQPKGTIEFGAPVHSQTK